MSQINAIVINITLDGQNYPEWAFSVETALRGCGLLPHLSEDKPVLKDDSSNANAVRTWETNDGKVMAAMVNSTKQSIIMSLRKFKTAKGIWNYLKQRYVQDSEALLHTLMQQTHVIEQHDMSIDEYYSAFDRLMGALTSMVPNVLQIHVQHINSLRSSLHTDLLWVFGLSLILFAQGYFRVLLISPCHRPCLSCLQKRPVLNPCQLLLVSVPLVCWQLLRDMVHTRLPLQSLVSIVARPSTLQTIVSLSIQRS